MYIYIYIYISLCLSKHNGLRSLHQPDALKCNTLVPPKWVPNCTLSYRQALFIGLTWTVGPYVTSSLAQSLPTNCRCYWFTSSRLHYTRTFPYGTFLFLWSHNIRMIRLWVLILPMRSPSGLCVRPTWPTYVIPLGPSWRTLVSTLC